MRGVAITRVCAATRMLRPSKLAPKTTFCVGRKGEFREPLNNFGTKCTGEIEIRLSKMDAITDKKGEKENCEEKQARMAKVEGVSLKCDFEQRRPGCGNPKIKRLASNAEIQIILRNNAQFGFSRKESGPMITQHPSPKGGNQKVKRKEGKGGAKAVRLACLEPAEKGPENEEIPETK